MLADLARDAIGRRQALLSALPETDCVRLFHGATEGVAGLTVDRYGPILLIQTFREPLTAAQLDALMSVYDAALMPVYNHRGEATDVALPEPNAAALADHVGHELGLRFLVRARHRGKDPLLFLDFRAGRRWVRANCQGQSVLNLFAYTCGIGVAAAAGGAETVWNVDFAASALNVGRDNATLNGVSMTFIETDAIPALRQLSGLGVKGRGARRRRFKKLPARQFDRVILDPPTWATTPFGAIDIVRDYPALFKPAILATAPGGQLLATNHVSTVTLEGWLDTLRRCAQKAGRPIRQLHVLTPEADFPSPDGKHPLKMAIVEV
ncbi:MAG: class I SAM-dependent methyltransferase [Myxococcota bacterium]